MALDDDDVGGMLEHRVVDRDPLDCGEFPGEDRLSIGTVPGRGDRPQSGQTLGLVGCQGLDDGGCLPDEDPSVPEIVAGRQIFLRHAGRRLFPELGDPSDRGGAMRPRQRFSLLDVAEALGRIAGTDAEGHEPAGRFLDKRRRLKNRLPKPLRRMDHVI